MRLFSALSSFEKQNPCTFPGFKNLSICREKMSRAFQSAEALCWPGNIAMRKRAQKRALMKALPVKKVNPLRFKTQLLPIEKTKLQDRDRTFREKRSAPA